MSALMDIWHAIQAVVTAADYYTLGAAILMIVIAGFLTDKLGVISSTLVALIGFVVLKFILAMVIGTGPHDAEAIASADWKAFVDLKMLVFVAHAIVFGVLIGVVGAIRYVAGNR